MAGTVRKIGVISCWKYLEDEPPIPSIKVKVQGLKVVWS